MESTLATIQPLWQAAFGDLERPQAFRTSSPDDDGFQPITEAKGFIADLDPMTQQQLYAYAENTRIAMVEAQQEYLALDKLIKSIEQKDQPSNPLSFQEPELFEEEKEASLYGYEREVGAYRKYWNDQLIPRKFPADESQVPADVKTGYQRPFESSRFIPTSTEYARKLKRAKDPKNIDGWTPILLHDKQVIPRPNRPAQPISLAPKRKRKAGDIGPEESSRPSTAESMDPFTTPGRATDKRLTRFAGSKPTPTRDVSETPSYTAATTTPRRKRQNTPKLASSTPNTPVPTDSPTPSKRRKPNHAPTRSPAPRNPASRISTTAAPPAAPTENPPPPPSNEPPSLLSRKWTKETLLEAVQADHSWLNPDPIKAQKWANKILASKFPVRTLSMFRKWAFWRENDQDKRPRRDLAGRKGAVSVGLRVRSVTEDIEGEEKGRATGDGIGIGIGIGMDALVVSDDDEEEERRSGVVGKLMDADDETEVDSTTGEEAAVTAVVVEEQDRRRSSGLVRRASN